MGVRHERKKRGERSKGAVDRTFFNDEAELANERRTQRAQRDSAAEDAETRASAARLLDKGKGKLEYLRHLDVLRQEQQQAHKRGDTALVKKLEKKINPDPDSWNIDF